MYRFFAGLLILFAITGCSHSPALSDNDSKIYSQLHKKYNQMESYSATLRVTVRSNKTENQYTMRQKVKSPDQAVVTLEEPASLAGVTTVFSGDFVTVVGETALTIPTHTGIYDLFVNQFFSQYYQSEETAHSVSANEKNQGTILLETVAIPNNDKRYKLTLLCDTKTLEPKRLTVYDVGGNIRIIADFLEFSYNPSFDSKIFMVQ